MSKNWTCSSLLCFFEKLPQCFPSGNSAKNMGTRITGNAVQIHISSKMSRELCAIYQTMYHLWFLVYQRVLPQLHFHLLLHHLHHKIPYLMSTDRPKIQYQKEVEVRVESFGETRCMNPKKPKTKIKMGNRKKYKEIFRMNCLISYRNSERIWLMKILPKGGRSRGNPMQKVLEPIQRVRFTKSTLRHASILEKKRPSLGKINVKVSY